MTNFGLSSRANVFSTVPIQRIRVRFSRSGAAAQLSHLQQIDAIRRAVEKSSWPTRGAAGELSRMPLKKSKMKIAFGPAISVGYESDCEYCDIELVSRLDLKTAKEELQPHLPHGYELMEVKSIPRFFPSLEKSLNVARYEIRSILLPGTRAQWEKFWGERCFVITKKKADGDVAIDARPLVHTWELSGDCLKLVLRFGPGRTLKPERIIQAVCGFKDDDVMMGTAHCQLQIRRTNMYFEKQNGDLAEL